MNVTVCHSHQQRCGVREYGLALDKSLIAAGVELQVCSYDNFGDGIGAGKPGSILLVHYEPSLTTAWYLSTYLRAARAKGMKTVLCCHLYDHAILSEYNGLVDRFVLHRSYPLRHVESTVIPLGCPVYVPPVNREELRVAYPFGSTVLTTIGFLTQWKKLHEIATAMLSAMEPHSSLFLHMHTPKPYYSDASVENEETRLRHLFSSHRVGSRARLTTDFLHDTATLDIAHAADVGFLYHPIHTNSVSAATKQFVSGRRPLVVTGSTHAWDLKGGVERVEGFDAWAFAHKAIMLALDREKRARLEVEMQKEYDRMNMHAVAKEYIDLFRSLL
jgi:hypothetical protein